MSAERVIRQVPGWVAMAEHSAAQLGLTAEDYWTRIQDRDAEIEQAVQRRTR